MNYREALAWLYGTQTFGVKLGLDNTRRLLAAAGDPQQCLRFLHVAGTNGKGSTCAMMDSILRAAGYRSALYTSPHLVDFRERIRLEGVMIPESAAADGLTLLRGCSAGWDHAPTFFELATVLAAWWFARKGADYVVWETGMGGRLDATNAVTPLVSVITPIGLDHQQWLGHTLAEIAAEKAGIIKNGLPVVSAPQTAEVRAVLETKAAAEGTSVFFVDEPWQAGPLGLPGEHQRWNAALACAALEAAGCHVDNEARHRGLARIDWPARFHRIGDDLVVDGAHNVSGCEALVATWREVFGATKARVIFGAMRDKDVAAILQRLRAISDRICLVPIAGGRSLPVDELRAAAISAGYTDIETSTIAEALPSARAAGDPVLVTGSLFLAGEVLAFLDGAPPPVASAQ